MIERLLVLAALCLPLMAHAQTIPNLPTASAVSGGDLFAGSQSGVTRKISLTQIRGSATPVAGTTGTFTGVLTGSEVNAGTGAGRVILASGGSGSPGYVSIIGPTGVRAGYVGFAAGARLTLTTESSYTGWYANGTLETGGALTAGSAASPASGSTALLIRVNDGTTTSTDQVTVGAADSCGTGFRCLRIPN